MVIIYHLLNAYYVQGIVENSLLHSSLDLNNSMSKVKVAQSCQTVCDPMDCVCQAPWNSPGKNTGVGSHSLLQGIFPTQGWKPGLSHCRWILYHRTHQGSHHKVDNITTP